MSTAGRVRIQCKQLQDAINEYQRLILLNLEPSAQERDDLVSLAHSIRRELESLPSSTARPLSVEYAKLLEQLRALQVNSASLGFEPEAETSEDSLPVENAGYPLAKASRFRDSDISDQKKVRFSNVTESIVSEPYTGYADLQDFYEENIQLLEHQDRRLEALAASVRTQREIGGSIDAELRDHIVLLDDLEEQTDRTHRRIDTATRRTSLFNKKAREAGPCTLIVVLTLILFILIVLL